MLIVDSGMLQAAGSAATIGDGSYAILHEGTSFSFGDSSHKVFTGQATDFSTLFVDDPSFNEDIGYWDMSNALNTFAMFRGASAFDRDISAWDVSSVGYMVSMFDHATAFNQDLSSWCVAGFQSAPDSFDVVASSWTLPKPIWGTCPDD